jgi:hypothetical protein
MSGHIIRYKFHRSSRVRAVDRIRRSRISVVFTPSTPALWLLRAISRHSRKCSDCAFARLFFCAACVTPLLRLRCPTAQARTDAFRSERICVVVTSLEVGGRRMSAWLSPIRTSSCSWIKPSHFRYGCRKSSPGVDLFVSADRLGKGVRRPVLKAMQKRLA